MGSDYDHPARGFCRRPLAPWSDGSRMDVVNPATVEGTDYDTVTKSINMRL